jgi:tetratricopeptide (TPR) repeat protein
MNAPSLKQLLDDVAARFRNGESPAVLVGNMEKFLRNFADDPVFQYQLGYLRLQAGRTEAGAEALRRSIALEEDPLTWLHLGYALIELNALDEACEALTRSLELGGPEQARYELAYALHLAADYEAAARVARLYVLRERDDPDGWELYEAVCRRLNRESTYRRFVARHGDHAMVELLRGRDEFSMGAEPFPVPVSRAELDRVDVKRDFLSGVGAAYVGGDRDDGFHCTADRRFVLSRNDIAMMLARLNGVFSTMPRSFRGVLPADELSRPVSAAAAELYGLPLLDARLQPHDVDEGARTLWLQVLGQDWLSFARATHPHGERMVTAVLAFDWVRAGLPFQRPFAPDACGMLALDVRYNVSEIKDEETYVRDLIAAARAVLPEESPRQRYYYRSQPGLRFR